ncbi:MAG: carbamoyltransferase [Planctomycetaceae bacterium]|nr:carbamoyltransferase [Planctomycetaceae bacterium]
MTAILGISAFYHDAAAALVVDGQIIAAAQEERFSRVKNDRRFPFAAIRYCLDEAGLTPGDLDYVGFYEKPLRKFDRVLETHCAAAPGGFRAFARSIPGWLTEKLHVAREVRHALPGFSRRVLFAEHHESHAASAFFPSPFDEAAILTIDGVGEWATATIGAGRGNRIELLSELRFPHSLGLLYSAVTSYCGFAVDSGEYKLMGLAPYGEPNFADDILQHIVDLRPDGSLRLDMSYFDYGHGLRMTSEKLHRRFGGPPRPCDAPLEQRHCDLAASIQKVTEEVLLRMARHAREQTGLRNLCLAGGVALNAVANARLLAEGTFDDVWIQPAAGDAGGALGAALLVWHQLLEQPRTARTGDSQRGSRLGPAFRAEEIRACLTQQGAVFTELPDEAAVCRETARLLAAQKVVGWFQGRMEFGPRALGNRSILADPRNPRMQQQLNQQIKFRESFRPFAPAVLAENAAEYFDLPAGRSSPYMLLVAPVSESQRVAVTVPEPRGLARLAVVRSRIPAVTHVDFSSRLQTVDEERAGLFATLLREFRTLTGCPLLVNTSFNVRDEPIVCSPQDAYDCFAATNMHALVLGTFLILKEQQPRTRLPTPSTPSAKRPRSESALLAGSTWIDSARPASPRDLRIFGVGLLIVAGVLGIVSLRSAHWPWFWGSLAGLWSAAAAVFWTVPRSRASIHRCLNCLSAPLNSMLSLAVLAVIYYLILTPIALCRRCLRRDGRPGGTSVTYWQQRPPNGTRETYLQQF